MVTSETKYKLSRLINLLVKKIFAIIVVLALMSAGSYRTMVQGNYDTTAKFKALFMYSFTKYIEWPNSYKEGDFVVGVLGSKDSQIAKELSKMAATKKAITQTIKIKYYDSADEIDKCHMLFIEKSKGDSFSKALAKTKANSTLIVTEKDGLAQQGAGINFVIKDNRTKFELNKTSIEKKNLSVSSNLLSLAIQVY